MAIPTITSVSPNSGYTMGRKVIVITGTNFKQAAPAPNAAVPTVKVLFGTAPALDVQVISSTIVECSSPVHDVGVVSVSLSNLNSNGTVIVGETATYSSFTYKRQDFSAPSDLQRVVAELILDMRRQIIDNVVITTHLDYDDYTADKLNTVAIAQLPSIALYGPTLEENRLFTRTEREVVNTTGNVWEVRRIPKSVDLKFRVTIVSQTTQELLNLTMAVQRYFERNYWITVLRDPSNPGLGSTKIQLEADFNTPAIYGHLLTTDNLKQHVFACYLVGVPLEDLDNVDERTVTVEEYQASLLPGDFTPARLNIYKKS
jgi:hypothetical protein